MDCRIVRDAFVAHRHHHQLDRSALQPTGYFVVFYHHRQTMKEARKKDLEARIALTTFSICLYGGRKKHTVQLRFVLIARTSQFTVTSFCHAMRIKSVFPFSDFHDFFIAVLIIIIIIRTGGIVNVVPILRDMGFLFVLLSLFPATALSLLTDIESVDVVVLVLRCPVRERGFRRGSCCHAC